jgi:hypothetical protein
LALKNDEKLITITNGKLSLLTSDRLSLVPVYDYENGVDFHVQIAPTSGNMTEIVNAINGDIVNLNTTIEVVNWMWNCIKLLEERITLLESNIKALREKPNNNLQSNREETKVESNGGSFIDKIKNSFK